MQLYRDVVKEALEKNQFALFTLMEKLAKEMPGFKFAFASDPETGKLTGFMFATPRMLRRLELYGDLTF
jgi:hypothetical protein